MSAHGDTPLLDARGIGKRYGDATVLADVDLTLKAGVVHGLIGRNGAGKSTLVGILTGRHSSDTGEVLLDGRSVSFSTQAQAISTGVVAVPQELILPLQMSIREAVTLGAEPQRGGFIARRGERAEVRSILSELHLDLDIDAPVASLPVSSQKIILVAQLIHRRARVIALDEPTSAMNAEDAERVCQMVPKLRDRGMAVLYISHRLEEVERLCDEVTVLRDGRKVATLTGTDTRRTTLVNVMMQDVARRVDTLDVAEVPVASVARDGDHLTLLGTGHHLLHDFDLDVAPGEIVGVAGLPGSGVEEAFALAAGLARASTGSVRVGEQEITSVTSAVDAGVAFLPASRRDVLLADDGVVDNMVLGSLGASSRHSFLTHRRAREFCLAAAESLGLTPVLRRRIGQLSGGNQQRALVCGRLLMKPHFLVLEDPTVGVDIAARGELHDVIRQLSSNGLGVVVGSTDPQELVELCQRVVVVRRGRIVASLTRPELNEYALTSSMTGAAGADPVTAPG